MSIAAVSPALALEAREVHVWQLPLDRPVAEVERFATELSVDERARAARFVHAHDRRRFTVAHAAVRQILGAYLGASPRALAFTLYGQGKPALARPWADAGITFNLSHSYGLGLCAVARGRELGVDVEQIRALDDLDGLADQVFSPRERAALARLRGGDRVRGFFDGWTRKEAYVKALGDGLSHPLDSFDVSLTPGVPSRIERIAGCATPADRWSLLAVGVDARHAGAVVVQGRDVVLVSRQWPGDLSGGKAAA